MKVRHSLWGCQEGEELRLYGEITRLEGSLEASEGRIQRTVRLWGLSYEQPLQRL